MPRIFHRESGWTIHLSTPEEREGVADIFQIPGLREFITSGKSRDNARELSHILSARGCQIRAFRDPGRYKMRPNLSAKNKRRWRSRRYTLPPVSGELRDRARSLIDPELRGSILPSPSNWFDTKLIGKCPEHLSKGVSTTEFYEMMGAHNKRDKLVVRQGITRVVDMGYVERLEGRKLRRTLNGDLLVAKITNR